jgi:hypothetical protein
MAMVTRSTDPKARISLPKGFANSTVIIEQISDTELRIIKARVIPEEELQFPEVTDKPPLSNRDRDRFLSLLDNPSPPTQALLQAAKAAKTAEMSRPKGERKSGKGHRE